MLICLGRRDGGMGRQIHNIRLDNLRRLVDEAGAPGALARQADSSAAYFSQLRSGHRRMGDGLAARLEAATGKPRGWMDEPHRDGPAPDDAPWSDGGGCPLISLVQAGAWTEAYEFPEPEAFLHCPVRCGRRTFALRVAGESMTPRFQDGDLIFVDPDADPHNGSYVVVRRGDGSGAATFKQLIEEDGRRYLRALNPDWPQRIVEADPDAAICGVVVFLGTAL